MEQNKIVFTTEEGEQIPFFVIEQTTIMGMQYLLVTDRQEDDGDAEAYIMKKVTDDDSQIIYEMVDDDHELSAVSKVFEELLEDTDIEL